MSQMGKYTFCSFAQEVKFWHIVIFANDLWNKQECIGGAKAALAANPLNFLVNWASRTLC